MAAADGEAAAFAADASPSTATVEDARWDFARRPIAARRWRHDERVWGALAAVALHVLFAMFLWAETGPAAPASTEMVIVFELLPAVPAPVPAPELPRPVAAVARPGAETKPRRAAHPPASAPAADNAPDAAAEPVAARPLDLRLPEGAADLDVATPERKPWERAPALATEDTRFSNDWAPEGDAATDLAWRSPTAALVMSVFGRSVPCTDKEIRLRHPRCVPENAAYEVLP